MSSQQAPGAQQTQANAAKPSLTCVVSVTSLGLLSNALKMLDADNLILRLCLVIEPNRGWIYPNSGVRIKQRKGQAKATAKFEPEGKPSACLQDHVLNNLLMSIAIII